MVRKMIRWVIAYAAAVALMIVLGSAAHSWFVQEAWLGSAGEGATLSMAERATWLFHDMVGLQPLYGGLVAVALLLAFLAAGVVARFTGLRPVVYAVAGGVAILVMFITMKMTLGTVGVFGARGTAGLAAQAGAGILAGLIFARLYRVTADS